MAALAALVSVLLSLPARAAEQGPTVAVVAPDVGGAKGSGLVARQGDSCIVITLNSLVRDAQDINVETSGAERWTGARSLFLDQIDIATIVTEKNAKACSSLPAMDAIERALDGGDGEILLAAGSKSTVGVPVRVLRRGDNEIEIAARSRALPLSKSMLGAPLIMNGIPVAILTRVDETAPALGGTAFRLDQAARIAGRGRLPIIDVTVIVNSGTVLATMKDALARADGRVIRQYARSGLGAADWVIALRAPLDNAFVVTQFFETIKLAPERLDALTALLDAGVSPNQILPYRDDSEKSDPAESEQTLFWHAVDAGSAPAAAALLQRGALPHGYNSYRNGRVGIRMLYPWGAVYRSISEPQDRRMLLELMTRNGHVLPRARFFKNNKLGPLCENGAPTCEPRDRGDWVVDWTHENWNAPGPDALRAFAEAKPETAPITCILNQRVKPIAETGWEAVMANLPVAVSSKRRGLSLSVEAFVGVFKDKAWFMTRFRNFNRRSDDFGLVAFDRDMSRIWSSSLDSPGLFMGGEDVEPGMILRDGRCRLPELDK